MNIPYVKFDENRRAIIEGDFSFDKSPLLYNPSSFLTYFNFTFQFSPECPADLGAFVFTDEATELIAEKLKQDFIKFVQNAKPD